MGTRGTKVPVDYNDGDEYGEDVDDECKQEVHGQKGYVVRGGG